MWAFDPDRTPDRPRLNEFSSMPENSYGACNCETITSHSCLPMIRDRRFPWPGQQIMLVEIVMLRAVRRKPTVNGE